MKKALDVRVAQILEVDKIVINIGSDDNVIHNDRFLVYDEGVEIIDPTSGDSLGKLENPKGFFKVLHIQQKMSTLISELNRPKRSTLMFPSFLEVDTERDLLSSIKVGDKVKFID